MDELELVAPFDYQKIKHAFVQELQKASIGESSSISYFKHKLPENPIISSGIVQGIVIGGTNYIISSEKIAQNGTREVLQRKTGKLPVFDRKETLFSFLLEHLDPQALAIGVNFGFPLLPTSGRQGELDGILFTGTKEHSFTDMIYKKIGQEIKNLFSLHFDRNIPISVANDTVCLTLAGDGSEDGSMIAGTGFNIGIKKGNNIVVNLEVGNFDKFEPSQFTKIIDERSEKPGKQLFEKVISGKYLAEVFNIKAEKLNIHAPKLSTSQELSALSQEVNDDDANKLARKLLERSAFMVATALAGIYEFEERKDTITIIGEGSLLWKGWHYIQNIEKQLEELGLSKDAIRIKHVQNSSINGAIGLITA